MSNWINNLITLLQLIISAGTLITMFYALTRFLNRPNETQNDILKNHDKKFREVDTRLALLEARLNEGSDHFKRLDEATAVTQSALIVIMDSLALLVPEENSHKLREKRDKLFEFLVDKK